ncbi:MAG: PilZ domain-containing protein [Candidatus Acidiferrales bacterium]
MTSTLTEWEELKIETNRDRRQQPRTEARIPIEVCGFNRHGRFFSEKTATSDVSVGGCKFDLRTDVEKEAVIAIRVIKRRNGQELDSRPVLFQVNWFQAQPDGFTLGASKLQPGVSWSDELPRMENISKPNA